MTDRPTLFTRIRHAVFGAPVSYEEQQAARRHLPRSPVADPQSQLQSARYTGMHGGM